MTAAEIPDPKCPAAWATGLARYGFLHCILDPLESPHDADGWHEDPDRGRWKVTLSMGDFPVSGRSVPRGSGEAADHELRVRPELMITPEGRGRAVIRVTCGGCPGYRRTLEGDYRAEDLARLAVMHEGNEPE